MADDAVITGQDGVNPGSDNAAPAASPAAETASAPSVPETSVEGDVKPQERYVPYDRFKEVVDKVHTLESQLKETATPQNQEQVAPSDSQPWQPNSWDEVMSRAKQEVLTHLQSEQSKKQQELDKTTSYIENTLSELNADGKKFDKNKFLDFALDLAEAGMSDLKKAYELYEKVQEKGQAVEVQKADQRGKLAAKTASPVAEPSASTISYSRIHNKSLDELIADAAGEQ